MRYIVIIITCCLFVCGCTKSPKVTSISLMGSPTVTHAVSNDQLARISKIVGDCRKHMGAIPSDLYPDEVLLEVNFEGAPPLIWSYSRSGGTIRWVNNPRDQSLGCFLNPSCVEAFDKAIASAR